MSSSYALSLKKKDEERLKIKGAVYGDIYIRPYGECHPDFVSIPINHPHGPRVCIRKTVADNQSPPIRSSSDKAYTNLINTRDETMQKYSYSKNLYSVTDQLSRDRTRNVKNAVDVYEKAPNQDYLVERKYFRWEKQQNPLGFPNELWYTNGRSIPPTETRDVFNVSDIREGNDNIKSSNPIPQPYYENYSQLTSTQSQHRGIGQRYVKM